ncbi:cation:proton antiporter [Thiotrichales bacterium 19S11-10]|nr:cation:proton antiporter [Thiotrichales bacterium 19S11-10]
MGALNELAIIWICVYIANIFAYKTKLTSVLYFLALGAVLSNFHIISSVPSEFIRGLSELGIILIMFSLGFEESPNKFIKSIKRSWGIAFFGALAPFIAAYSVAEFFWETTSISIMVGLTMTATAVSLTMVSLRSEKLHQTKAAVGIMTSAILDDIASLILVAILVPLAAGGVDITTLDILTIIIKVIIFFSIILILGVFVFPSRFKRFFRKMPFLRKLTFQGILTLDQGKHTILSILLIALLVGLLAHYFGFHPAVGAYMAGLVLKEEYFFFDEHKQSSYEKARLIVDNAAFSWIGPVFFVSLGAQIIFDPNIISSIIPVSIALTISVLIAQVISASLAARYTGSFQWNESLLIGLGMLGRAELAFIVMDIAYVQNQIFSTEVFYTLMITAFFLNIAVPISIKLWHIYNPSKVDIN